MQGQLWAVPVQKSFLVAVYIWLPYPAQFTKNILNFGKVLIKLSQRSLRLCEAFMNAVSRVDQSEELSHAIDRSF